MHIAQANFRSVEDVTRTYKLKSHIIYAFIIRTQIYHQTKQEKVFYFHYSTREHGQIFFNQT